MEDESPAYTKESEDISVAMQNVIKRMLQEVGVHYYDADVVAHLADYSKFYSSEILEQSLVLMKHAGRTELLKEDVELSLDIIAKKTCDKRLSQKELLELAQKHNKSQLPECMFKNGIPLPNNGTALTECNYKLKSIKPQLQVSASPQMVTFSTIRSNTGTTLIRTNPMPVNLTPQRIIFKPQTNNIPFTQQNDVIIKK